MIDLAYIRGFFPPALADNPAFSKLMLKEYLQLLLLDYISSSNYAEKLIFIGGTNLRLVKKIDRFSEDLDFDAQNLSKAEFMALTDEAVLYLRKNGLNAVARQKESDRLSAFRRSIYFPELLFELNLSGYREERLLIKIEAQDQGVIYQPQTAAISGCGFYFTVQIPPDSVLCAMKLSALIARQKGRDFYDSMFLLAKTEPDINFLRERQGINSPEELKKALLKVTDKTDLNIKKRDFEHLLFNPRSGEKILHFREFIESRW